MKIKNIIEKLNSSAEVKIAALGDSLTYGWMTQHGYLDFLQQMLKKKYPASDFKILNRGIPGDTAKDGLRRVENDVIRLAPDLVFVQFALNDAYTDFSPEDFQKNIESIVLKIKEKTDAEIVLLTSVALLNPDENRIARMFYGKLHECGERHNIPVVSVDEYWENKIASGIKHSSLVQADGIHPNEKGYELMAEAVFQIF